MIKIGDICPLFFNPIKNEFQQDIDYIQKFHSSDTILVQVLSDNQVDEVSFHLHDLVSGQSYIVEHSNFQVNSSVTLYQAQLFDLKDSMYSLEVKEEVSGYYYMSEPFSVCSDSLLLKETCLIQYSNEDNNSPFDNIFWIDGAQQVFEFRIEGGFKPEGVSSKVDNEQFRNQFQEIVELYSVPYNTYTLTCGNASGLPYWMVLFINNILSLSHFIVNEQRYVRSGNSVPEKTQISEDGQMFNMTVLLEKNTNEYFMLSPTLMKVSSESSSYIARVRSNLEWSFTIEEGNSFISSKEKDFGKGSKDIVFDVTTNSIDSQRTGKIKFTTEEGESYLIITQEKKNIYITIEPLSANDEGIAGEKRILITSNIDYDILSDSSWLTANKKEGNIGVTEVVVNYAVNDGEERVGKITATGKPPYQTTTAVFTFTQRVHPSKFLIIKPSSLKINGNGDEQTINISGYRAWRLINKPDWATVSPASGGNILGEYAETDVIIKAEPNPENVRRGQIEFITYDAYLSKIVEIEQERREYITVDPDKLTVSKGNDSEMVILDSSEAWNLSTKPDWVSVTPDSGGGASEVLTIEVLANTGLARTGTVRLETVSGVVASLIVEQAGEEPDVLLIPNKLYFTSAGETKNIQVKATNVWDASYIPNWIDLNPRGGNAGITTVQVTVDENAGPERSDNIDFEDSETSFVAGLYVAQADDDGFMLTPSFPLSIESAGLIGSYTIISDKDWEVLSMDSGISINPMQGSAGTTDIEITVSPNNTDSTLALTFSLTGDKLFGCIQSSDTGTSDIVSRPTFFSNQSANGNLVYARVVSIDDWVLNSNLSDDWLSLFPTSGKAGATDLRISINPNRTGISRNGILRLETGGDYFDITVIQNS